MSSCQYDKMSCLNIKSITPLEHQKQICKFLIKDKARGVLVFHSVGSGKTITSLLAAKCLLKKFPNKNVIITTGTSLVQNFDNEIRKLKLENDNRITVTSYGVFINRLKNDMTRICKNNILIIDEAHNFGRPGVRSKYLINCAIKAFKVILLTATPVKNKPEEITNLMAMISGKYPKDIKNDIREALSNSEKFKEMFECKVSFFNTKDVSNYPSNTEHIIKLKMSEEYYKEYYKIEQDIKEDIPDIFANTKNLVIFLNGSRRAVNKTKTISPKIIWTLEKIESDIKNNKKILIYSSWKQAGINILKTFMDEKGIIYSEVSGELSKEVRKDLVEKYNSGITKVIIVTAAGAEGLDLKGTRSIVIIEPHWNEARTQQIIGRGIRYGSHTHLPINQRHVDIYYLLLEKPVIKYRNDNVESADMILRQMSLYKSAEIIEFYNNLKKLSIEKFPKKC